MRTAHSLLLSLFVSSLIAASSLAQNVDVTGSWSGTYSFSDSSCGSSSTGPASAYFTQQGTQVSGALGLSNYSFAGTNCADVGSIELVLPFAGTASGSTITTTGGSITVSGNTMTISFSSGLTGTATLTRTSTAAPAFGTGSSSGTYSATDKWEFCSNSISYSGSVTGTATRSGPLVSATLQGAGAKFPQPQSDGTCTTMDSPNSVVQFYGEISGNSVSGSLILVGIATFTGTLNGNTVTGTAKSNSGLGLDSTVNVTFTLPATTTGGGGAKVVIPRLPAGMLQPAGAAGATDTFSLTNNGDASTQITLTPSQSFFTIAPSSFKLDPGQTQVVSITANAEPAGSYTGSVSIAGSGVPAGASVNVQLLSATPPRSNVDATPAVSRVESVSTGTTSSGSIVFTNTGSDTLQGLVTADVRWLTANNPVVSIPPGGSTTINFTIDRTKRPDADALLGSASCNLSVSFLTAAGSAAKPTTHANGSSRTVSVPVQDTVKPAINNGSPSALAAGELALFAAGMRAGNQVVSDLVIAQRRAANVNDLKLFAAPSASAFSKVLNVPALTGDLASAFAGVSKNVFDISGTPASVQFRSSQAASIAPSAVQVSTPSGRASYSTALPVLRSDAGVSANEKLFLPGVEKSATLTTALDLQELTGNPSSVLTEFLRADGSVLSSRTDSLAAFGFLEVGDAVPSGASAVRVTNTSSGSRVAAYARVNDNATGDTFTVIDPKVDFPAASGDLIVPVFAGNASSSRFIDVTNAGAAATSVRITTVGGGQRRRSARVHSGGGDASYFTPQTEADRTINVGAQQTQRVTIDPIANGFVRINATTPLAASGRLVFTTSTNNAFGSTLPAIPVSAAIGINQNRRFTGISDAGQQAVSAGTPGTYRPTLMLIETAGQTAKVRVTLNYTLPGGARAVASATAQRELNISASQSIVITDLAASFIGSQRVDIGDLRNMQVDIDVIEGGGRIIPVIAMVDNSTGDFMVRAE